MGRDGAGPELERARVGPRDVPPPAAARVEDARELVLRRRRLGRKRVIQVRFNMSVPRARVPEKASMRRDRFER